MIASIDTSVKKKFTMVLPGADDNVLRASIYFFLRTPPGTFSLFIMPALTPPEYQTTICNQKLFWTDRDFVGGGLVGISCSTINAVGSYNIAKRFRKNGAKVIMGGAHVTNLPEEALNHCDAIVLGEAESVWPQVVRDYENGELKRIYQGVAQEDYFTPCFDYFMKLDPKLLYSTGLLLSRGCKWHCDFCAPMHGKKLRLIKMEQAIALIEKVSKAQPRPFGIKPIIFIHDDNIYNSPAYAKELFQKMIPLNISWMGNSSIDISFDEELLGLAQESGCRGLFVGFESINPERYPKTSTGGIKTPEDYLKAIRRIQAHKIKITGSFVLGLDDDKPSDYLRLIWFWMRAGFEVVSLTMLTPYPGTLTYKKMKAENRLITSDWSKYDPLNNVVFKPKNMSPGALYAWYLFMRVVGLLSSRVFLSATITITLYSLLWLLKHVH